MRISTRNSILDQYQYRGNRKWLRQSATGNWTLLAWTSAPHQICWSMPHRLRRSRDAFRLDARWGRNDYILVLSFRKLTKCPCRRNNLPDYSRFRYPNICYLHRRLVIRFLKWQLPKADKSMVAKEEEFQWGRRQDNRCWQGQKWKECVQYGWRAGLVRKERMA